MIIEKFPCGPVKTNCYLLGCSQTKFGAVIDAPFESVQIILKSAEAHGLTIQMLLFTHSHWDHIGEAALLKEATDARVYIHKEDAGNLENPGSDGLNCPFSIKGVKVDHFLEEGESIRLGDLVMSVIHTPGHTPGGCCFYLEKQHALFSGDTLFKGTYGRLDLCTAEPEKMGGSLKKLAELPPETRVYPGHGPHTTIQEEKKWIAY